MEKIPNQHGDVILKEVDSIPSGAKKIKNADDVFVVEKGEGVHKHTIQAVELETKLDVYEKEGILYFKPLTELPLTHEEHGIQTLTPGKIYKKVIEREFDYESMEARNTQD